MYQEKGLGDGNSYRRLVSPIFWRELAISVKAQENKELSQIKLGTRVMALSHNSRRDCEFADFGSGETCEVFQLVGHFDQWKEALIKEQSL